MVHWSPLVLLAVTRPPISAEEGFEAAKQIPQEKFCVPCVCVCVNMGLELLEYGTNTYYLNVFITLKQ